MQVLGSPIDYVIVGIYFAGILGFGAYFARFTKTTHDFFFGGQRFSWWLITFSLIATGIGSYSFLKYAQAGFTRGMSSTLTYLNDWFMLPLFMFGWLPIIYFSRIKSIPEYFARRFDERVRVVATIFTLLYLLGYIGLNFYLLGLALKTLLGLPMHLTVPAVAAISAVYVMAGGQTAVIFTDLIQGLFLYLAGAVLLFLGIAHLGGFDGWWSNLDLAHRLPFPGFNRPHDFNYAGIFWSEGVVGTLAFTFMNQGFIMRYLACKSVYEGRKTMTVNTLIFMPISAIVVGNIGWFAASMVFKGQLPPDINPKEVFVTVANIVCRPGIFGFVIAALTAALMSTIDTLINATTAIAVFDVYKPFLGKGKSDKHYLRASRAFSLVSTIIGLVLVLLFTQSRSIFDAHYTFVAMITPPMLVAIFLGVVWHRFSASAAFWSMVIGAVITFGTGLFPGLIAPLASTHGMDRGTRAEVAWMSRGVPDNLEGVHAIYNWQEQVETGAPSDYHVEYAAKNAFDPDNPSYTGSARVQMRTDIVGGQTVYRYAAVVEGLAPRTSYVFRVVDGDGVPIVSDAQELLDNYVTRNPALAETALPPPVKLEFRTGGKYGYFRGLFSLALVAILALCITPFTARPLREKLGGLTIWTIADGKHAFKGGTPNERPGRTVRLHVQITPGDPEEGIQLSTADLETLAAEPGDLLYLADSRKRLGGLRSLHAKAGTAHSNPGIVLIPEGLFDTSNLLPHREVRVEKII